MYIYHGSDHKIPKPLYNFLLKILVKKYIINIWKTEHNLTGQVIPTLTPYGEP